MFCDNSTAVAYLRNQGGTLSESLNGEAQAILRLAEERGVSLIPQFILGSQNTVADSLSRQNQVLGSEWTLSQEVFDQICKKWPVNVDLFATALNLRCPLYFAPMSDPQSIGADAFLHPWDNLMAYAFPPFTLVRRVLNKVRESHNLVLTLIAPFWPQKEWFPDLLESLLEPPLRLPERRDLLRQPHFHHFHQRPQSLQLHAWRLSGGLPGMKASPGKSLSNQVLLDVSPPDAYTNTDGLSSESGVGGEVTPFLDPPSLRLPISSSSCSRRGVYRYPLLRDTDLCFPLFSGPVSQSSPHSLF